MSNNAEKRTDDDDYIRGLTSFKRPQGVEPLRSRNKGDDDEEVINKIEKLPEGYGNPAPTEERGGATSTLKARLSRKSHEEIIAHKKANVGLTYAAMVEEMWKLYKEKHGI